MDDIKQYLVDDKKLAIFIGALVIGMVVRLLKSDVKGPSIDPRWRMLAVWILGVGQMVLNYGLHMSWKQAAEYAVVSALMAVAGHETIIEWWRDGKELPLPGLMVAPSNDNATPTNSVDAKKDPPPQDSNKAA
jgi:hypothetical protein